MAREIQTFPAHKGAAGVVLWVAVAVAVIAAAGFVVTLVMSGGYSG